MDIQRELERETAVFESHLDEWRKTHLGQFVLIKEDRMVGFFDTLNAAFNEGTRLFGLERFFVKQITPIDTVNVSLLGRYLRSAHP